jgi:hypothetical protein
MSGATTAAPTAAQLQQQNASIRGLILQQASEMIQSIYTTTVNPTTNPGAIQIPCRNVGLAKGFIVELTATMSNTGTGSATLTNWNAANLLSNVTFYDLDNYQRLNTAGWFLNMLSTAKEGMPFGTALLTTAMDTPIKYGSNLNVISATATLAATSGTGTVVMRYWIPLAYSKSDLRGSVFLGVVNATAYLSITPNANMGSTTDGTLSVYYGGSAAVTCTSLAVTVYQVYLDQLPRYQSGQSAGAPILPPLDVATQYRIVTTSLTGVSAGQDFPIPFSNFQQFLSLGIIYDQAGTTYAGTDINYFALAAANTLQLFKMGAITQALYSRLRIKTDFPTGSYLFDFRSDPINTNQTGNMQLLVNPSSAATGSQFLCGFESFASINTILGAASLPAS